MKYSRLLSIVFEVGGDVLQRELVKTASSQYEETLRVERPQHNLVTDMVLELSRLPRFNAYAKLIDENQGSQIVRNHRIQSHPLPEKTNGRYGMPLFSAQFYGKKRDEIEAEIRERQSRWLRSSSKTPTTRGL